MISKTLEPSKRELAFSEISENLEVAHRYTISQNIYDGFLGLFEDWNPVHVDEEKAKRLGFEKPVIHGAVLHGFLSHFVGMVLPFRNTLLLSTEISYVRPCFLNDVLRYDARVDQIVESGNIIVLILRVWNESQARLSARARVQVQLREEPWTGAKT